MKSSSGLHFIALDHVRALAAFMVVTWHFIHATNGYPVPFSYVPELFPLCLLDEGHTGVALFMTLSGYLFAKLVDGKSISFGAFIWNRVLRLLPLLVIVILITGIKTLLDGMSLSNYVHYIMQGILLPTLPNGGWSITVEFHYYIMLPMLLWMLSKSNRWILSIVALSIALRFFLHHDRGEIQSLAYWTIIGRIDQFALGMFVCQFRTHFAHCHKIALIAILTLMMVYWYFDIQGGFYNYPSYPSHSPFWIILPTIEGIAYAIGIAWYDNSFSFSTSGLSKFISLIGRYSYSIYLLHFFVVFAAAQFVNERIMSISNFYLACFWSLIFFLLMMIPGYISFRFVESPFLKLRKNYIKK
ncbi:acyltransferase [Chamaesiphon sp. VAR_48_metabat_403]|uniref:acyltransferase family protein n=1 Tax=Chamaesiphon sp. VAR_48_metabat_403 TaxID=2964700 RepID=UPI00286DD5EA|nr:acyltransferase [Chamaesiphon sp. VAR_48_metabat_403]